jgi:ribosomal protein S18 acetylase RimI-like enzyme
LQIRRLGVEDAGAYWETRNRGLEEFPDAFTTSIEEGLATEPTALAKRLGGNGTDDFVLGAFCDDGRLAGYAGFQREARKKRRHTGRLVGMYVVAEFRRNGLGEQLLQSLIDAVRKLDGMEQLNLSVRRSNAGAQRLYLRAGFVSYGVEKNALKVDGVYYDTQYMALAL